MAINRRMFLFSLAIFASGCVGWPIRDWIPTRGLSNPCLAPILPPELATHPAVSEALTDLDRKKVWECHVHLLGTGDETGSDVWVNPEMDSLWHPIQAIQKRFYMNASCVTVEQGGDAAYLERLIALSNPMADTRLMLLAFDYSYDEYGQRRRDLSTFYVSN